MDISTEIDISCAEDEQDLLHCGPGQPTEKSCDVSCLMLNTRRTSRRVHKKYMRHIREGNTPKAALHQLTCVQGRLGFNTGSVMPRMLDGEKMAMGGIQVNHAFSLCRDLTCPIDRFVNTFL
ncbi:hypothetical protein J3459_019407 [Metarhizium acridum]|nr:hypothetical protein J3459_019407 [Metarhizium acridum]